MNDGEISLHDFSKVEGFEWDKGNLEHIKEHQVEAKECEQAFFNKPLMFLRDPTHSTLNERRFGALGKTDEGRRLEMYFTIRKMKIRVISAWNMSKKSRAVYMTREEQEKKAQGGVL